MKLERIRELEGQFDFSIPVRKVACVFLEVYESLRYCRGGGNCTHKSKEQIPYATKNGVGGREYTCKR
jgi:hypothetical protein